MAEVPLCPRCHKATASRTGVCGYCLRNRSRPLGATIRILKALKRQGCDVRDLLLAERAREREYQKRHARCAERVPAAIKRGHEMSRSGVIGVI
jgi:hypothetical protein